MSRIISYRGLLVDGGQDTINLHTNDGKTGYRVVKLQIMSFAPGSATAEHILQIFKIEQTTVPTTGATIDFQDNTLLAAAIVGNSTNISQSYSEGAIIFDNETFNQDIYITHTDNAGGEKLNYYIELEQIDLTEDQALVAIVKNLRNEQ